MKKRLVNTIYGKREFREPNILEIAGVVFFIIILSEIINKLWKTEIKEGIESQETLLGDRKFKVISITPLLSTLGAGR